MKPGIICCLALVAVFGGGCSIVGWSGKRVVTAVNANKLLGTIGAEQLDANLVILVPGGRNLPLDKDAPPGETLTIIRNQDIEERGRLYLLVKDDKRVAGVQLGVFANRKAARAVFQAHLMRTSMGPDKNLTAELGTKAVAWSVREEGQHLKRVLFVRDNVVVSIDIPAPWFAESGGSTKVIKRLVGIIDNALVQGTLGVQRGKRLKVPQIVGVELPSSVPVRGSVTAKVRIRVPENPQDRDSKYVEIVRDFAFYPSRVGASYHVTYITSGCVVASQVITLDVRRAATVAR